MNKTFVMYIAWQPLFDNLSDADAAKMIRAIYAYQTTGQEPEKEWSQFPTFLMIKKSMDENAEKYEKKCKTLSKNRNSLKSDRNETNQSDLKQISMKSGVIMGNTYTYTDTYTEKDSLEIENKGYFEDKDLNQAFCEYLDKREQCSMKDIDRIQKHLYELGGGDPKKMLRIVEASLVNGWKGLFKLDEDKKARAPTNKLKNHKERDYGDMSELEKEMVARSMRKGGQNE